MLRRCNWAVVAGCLGAAANVPAGAADTPAADVVLSDAKIYTVDKSHSIAEALAVRDGKIVFVGSSAEARSWVGLQTRVEKLGGRLVLPGLVDAHIHPLDIADLDVRDLDHHPLPPEA